eukprot:1737164-Prymnesium_polylepis.1
MEMCPATCSNAGVPVTGCAGAAAPPALPAPPAPPPMPPLIPGPSGFITVATVPQLQAAIDTTPRFSSLAVFLPPGTLLQLNSAPIIVDSITLEVASTAGGATLDAEHRCSIFRVLGSNAQLRLYALTLANAYSSGNGGSIAAEGGVTLSNVSIVNSTSDSTGGAVYIYSGSWMMAHNSSILNSSALRSGGAIGVGAGRVMVSRGLIMNAACHLYGGSIWLGNDGHVAVTNNSLIMHSFAGNHGGMLYNDGGHVVLSNSSVRNTTAENYGGTLAMIGTAAVLTMDNGSVIIGSSSLNDGGVMWFNGGYATVVSCSIVDSFSIGDGAVFHLSGGTATVTNASIANSTARSSGGVAYVAAGSLTISEGSSIVSSKAQRYGGAFFTDGGDIRVLNGSSILNSTAYISGGAMSLNGGSIAVKDSRVAFSDAGRGGGGCVRLLHGELHLTRVIVEHSVSSSMLGTIVIVPADTTGPGPLFLATFTRFRLHECDGSLFNQSGAAQIAFRNSTFTSTVSRCKTALLNPQVAFAGITPKGCGETYIDHRSQQPLHVCSSRSAGACSAQPVANTNLVGLTCQCPDPETVDPAKEDPGLAPYLVSGGCITPMSLTDVTVVSRRVVNVRLSKPTSIERTLEVILTVQGDDTSRPANWSVLNASLLQERVRARDGVQWFRLPNPPSGKT